MSVAYQHLHSVSVFIGSDSDPAPSAIAVAFFFFFPDFFFDLRLLCKSCLTSSSVIYTSTATVLAPLAGDYLAHVDPCAT